MIHPETYRAQNDDFVKNNYGIYLDAIESAKQQRNTFTSLLATYAIDDSFNNAFFTNGEFTPKNTEQCRLHADKVHELLSSTYGIKVE